MIALTSNSSRRASPIRSSGVWLIIFLGARERDCNRSVGRLFRDLAIVPAATLPQVTTPLTVTAIVSETPSETRSPPPGLADKERSFQIRVFRPLMPRIRDRKSVV